MEMITLLLLLLLRSSASFTKIILRYFRCHSGGIAFHHPPHPAIIILELKNPNPTQPNKTIKNMVPFILGPRIATLPNFLV